MSDPEERFDALRKIIVEQDLDILDLMRSRDEWRQLAFQLMRQNPEDEL